MAERKNEKFWQTELKNSTERLRVMRARNLYTDCVFQIGHQVFSAHKNILAMSSPVFETMFFGSLKEDTKKPILIEDLDVETFNLLLNYIYENSPVVLTSIRMADKVLYAAKKYMLDSLALTCKNYCAQMVTSQNACEVFEFAEKYQLHSLKDRCLQLFRNNTSDVLLNCDYSAIDIETLLVILQQREIKIISEINLFNAIEKYAKAHRFKGRAKNTASCCNTDNHQGEQGTKGKEQTTKGDMMEDGECREELKILKALKTIRFLTMTALEFSNGPALSNLLLDKEKIPLIVNIVTGTIKLPMPQDFSLSRVLRGRKCNGCRQNNCGSAHYGYGYTYYTV